MRRLGTLAGFIGALLVALCATHPTHAGDVLDRVRAKGVVPRCYRSRMASLLLEGRQRLGRIYTSVAQEIAKRIGVKVEFFVRRQHQ